MQTKKAKLKNDTIYQLENGLRIVHQRNNSRVAYFGAIVGVGSRDENDDEQGLAHFLEHLIFKGTKKRKAVEIIHRLEDVGGELNAFTTKEYTVLYSAVLKQYTQRAIDLIADMVQNATFPQHEIDKEVEVIKDEILSYKDSPSELIVDEFEEMIFGSHSLSHNILGTEKKLDIFDTQKAKQFYERHYTFDKMVVFFSGDIAENKVIKWCERYFDKQTVFKSNEIKLVQPKITQRKLSVQKNTFQTHALVGGEAYSLYAPERVQQALLNNIIGGPGMNSLLNLSLREKNGLVYNVESILQPFSDCGWWGVYFATDSIHYKKSRKLVASVLKKVKEVPFSNHKLEKYKKQLIGQLVISLENQENSVLQLGKNILRYGKQQSLEQTIEQINEIKPQELQQIANQLFADDNISELTFY